MIESPTLRHRRLESPLPYQGITPQGVPAKVRQQVLALGGKAYRLSFTDQAGSRDCMLVVAWSALAVLVWAQRDLSPKGYSDFCVGGYRGGTSLTPARSRSKRSPCV